MLDLVLKGQAIYNNLLRLVYPLRKRAKRDTTTLRIFMSFKPSRYRYVISGVGVGYYES
jgi:hypothetical protein